MSLKLVQIYKHLEKQVNVQIEMHDLLVLRKALRIRDEFVCILILLTRFPL